MKRISRFIFVAVALLLILFVAPGNYCPTSGLALTAQRREFQQLKNRTALPQASDFDTRVTLGALLQAGDDQARWPSSRAATLEGYVISISPGPLEAANCFCRRDVHVMIGARPDSQAREQVVLEVTPRMATTKDPESLKQLTGRRVRFEGWLFFDGLHVGEAENTAPGKVNNWRATAWELHPITKIELLK